MAFATPDNFFLVDNTETATSAAVEHETTLMAASTTKLSSMVENRLRVVCHEVVQLMHVTSINIDMPALGHLPVAHGIADIEDGLSNWSDSEIGKAFESCLAAADRATDYTPPAATANRNAVNEMRFVAALHMFAGPKHQKGEKLDDRTMLTTKLYTTGALTMLPRKWSTSPEPSMRRWPAEIKCDTGVDPSL